MKTHAARPSLTQQLAEAAAAYQAAAVIPHCAVCSRPCCNLDALVLELNWRQVKTLWRLDESRSAFDRRLNSGQGPVELRAGNGLYYAHTRPCPAYDATQQRCGVYGQAVKPVGCSDFPVYEQDGCVTADLRCEAVDLAELAKTLEATVGPAFRVTQKADVEFPFLVTLSLKRRTR